MGSGSPSGQLNGGGSMVALIVFNVVMIAVAVVVGVLIPPRLLTQALYGLHVSVGITAPTPRNARMVALIWIATVIATVDGMALLLVLLT